MKSIVFWSLDATVLFVLSLLYLHQGYHRKNPLFAVWLCNGVAMQLIAAWALAAGPPPWINQVRMFEDIASYVLAAGVIVTAAIQRSCPINRVLLFGVGAMVVLSVFATLMGVHVAHSVQVWLRNIAFFGPAIFLMIALSNIRLDMLPLWIHSVLWTFGDRWVEGPALAAIGLFGALRGRRHY